MVKAGVLWFCVEVTDLDGFESDLNCSTWGQEEVKAEDEEEEQVAAEDMFWAWQVGSISAVSQPLS